MFRYASPSVLIVRICMLYNVLGTLVYDEHYLFISPILICLVHRFVMIQVGIIEQFIML